MGFYATESMVETGRRETATALPSRRSRLNRKPHIGASRGRGKFLTDHLGSVHALTDETGTIVESYRYDAFGRVLGVYNGSGTPLTESAVGNRFLWAGKEYSFKTGLYHNRHRVYDPVTGRFLSKDPSGISGGLNEFIYCFGNPVNFFDPDGLNAYVVNSDGYLGHTSIAVDNPSGGVNVYHYYARGHHAGANSWNTAKAIVYDKVDMWSEHHGSIEDYLSACQSVGSKVRVDAIALGTSQDDASLIDYMDDETCKDEGYYSGLGGRECHTTSWSAFWTYGMGPMKSFPTPKLDIMKSNPLFRNIPLPDRTYMTPNLMMPSLR
jgi:RHS repeat-associated protein